MGVFNVESIQKNEFVTDYQGELITDEENYLRQELSTNKDFYNFTYYKDSYQIDGKYYGNKSRFFNHSKTPNIYPKYIFSQGQRYVAFYAKRYIEPGTELVFDYDADNYLQKLGYEWIKMKQTQKSKLSLQSQGGNSFLQQIFVDDIDDRTHDDDEDDDNEGRQDKKEQQSEKAEEEDEKQIEEESAKLETENRSGQ